MAVRHDVLASVPKVPGGEVDPQLPDAESIKSVLVVPRSGADTGEGLWRVVPWSSIAGENSERPF